MTFVCSTAKALNPLHICMRFLGVPDQTDAGSDLRMTVSKILGICRGICIVLKTSSLASMSDPVSSSSLASKVEVLCFLASEKTASLCPVSNSEYREKTVHSPLVCSLLLVHALASKSGGLKSFVDSSKSTQSQAQRLSSAPVCGCGPTPSVDCMVPVSQIFPQGEEE